MAALARPSSKCKQQTHPLVREDYNLKGTVEKNCGRGSQGALRQNELIRDKPPVVKLTPTLTFRHAHGFQPSICT
jgi:hypothetical protein